ncbi:NADP-dependent oxidoreductase [Streptomyces sp. NPDC050560]|uniref:NADP-dependent oxidoreductase n=1 Tax=Streptomyces sp. NPDC050560 TaxID=3365630 RepID=UPI00378BAB21
MAKAYVYTRHGGPETQSFVDREVAEPGRGELLVAVRAAGVNPVDHKLRGGYTRPGGTPAALPAVLGSEAAGTVERVGPGVEGFAPGDAVFGTTLDGAFTELTLMPTAVTAHKPEGLSFAVAATLPVAAATAYDAVHQLALPPGATLLVTGAGGGVGVAAVQLATALGLRVIGTASRAKADFVRSLGDGVVHIPSDADLPAAVAAAAPGGVDGVLDLVGGDVLATAAALLDDRAKLLTAADKQSVTRYGGQPVVRARNAAVLDAVGALAADGTLDPHITEVLPLEQAGEALRLVEEGHARGKVVIEVSR